MDTSIPFKWRHYQAEIILLCVRGYLRYPLSYRDLEEIMRERDYISITRRSTVGYNATHQNWRNAADLISKPPTTRGVSMRPT